MNFQSYKRWISIGLLVAACAIVPQTVKADTVIESDGVMGQSITDEMQSDPAEDYVWLSAGMEAPAAFDVDAMPLFRASSYTDLFLASSFTTVSDLNGSTYYHNNTYADYELINGIDVSWWQGGGRGSTTSKINWQKMHDAGTDFVFVRAASRDTSDASIYEDTTASAHIDGAQANKMNVGLYIFSQAINEDEAVEEADYVLNLIDQYGWNIDMPIVIDREAGRQTKRLTNAKLSKAKETSVVQAFADEITAAGYKAGVYASYSWYNTRMNAEDLSDCAIWIARYNNTTTSNVKQVKKKDSKGSYVKDEDGNYVMVTPVPYEDVLCDYEFWQYSSSKPSASTGYTGTLDKNFWYKDTNVQTENLKTSKISADSITLTWDDAGDAERYRVYRYNSETGKYGYLGTVSDTTYTDKNLQAGTEYRYKVRCMWTIGGNNYFGTYSSVVGAATPPAKVENVSVDGLSSTKIKLSWDSVSGVSGYRILQYNSDSDDYEEVASVGAGATNLDVTKLIPASVYQFKVQAYKTIDTQTSFGEASDEIVGVTKPGKVKKVKLTTKSSAVTIKWSKADGVTGYQIYRLNTKTKKYEKIATVKGEGKISYKNKKLKKGSTYSYKVRAYMTVEDTDYFGGYSAAAKIKVK